MCTYVEREAFDRGILTPLSAVHFIDQSWFRGHFSVITNLPDPLKLLFMVSVSSSVCGLHGVTLLSGSEPLDTRAQ